MIPESVKKLLNDFRPAFPEKAFYGLLAVIVLGAVLTPIAIGSGLLRVTNIEFLNGMGWQNKAKTQMLNEHLPEGIVVQPPVEGTVPRGVSFYPFEKEEKELAGQSLFNPIPVTKGNLERGRQVYEVYCLPCHGYRGMGDGGAVGEGRLPAPLSLQSDTARAYSDGALFHIITMGQNTMPGYAKQIDPEERWMVVHYLRALQRSMNPNERDMQLLEQEEAKAETEESNG